MELQEKRPTIKFRTKCYLEGSWGSRSLGVLDCSMELFDYKNGSALIEFIAGDEVEHIGLSYTKEKKVTDYDGVCSLPSQAVELLKSCGFNTEEIEE